ncbi:hypothetical protein C4B68_01375 [Streptomyces dengpaensis]|uniref:Mutator family transposase n=1 Tax=Streptomyces dengpaensis TaxID=2049881 RepID=A0ABN5HVS4_9ACTN|nr:MULTISPECIES: transposase [Streptomyces]AVH54695.1 hypothetical protein C4B68_01375 [Streptomyces dengpaensis]
MSTTTDHLIEAADGVSLAGAGESVEGAEVKSMPVSANGLSSELLEELAALAAEKVRLGGLRLMGEGGLLPELAQHLMQAALEAEMDVHLAAEAGQAGGRGSRSGGNMRNGYRAKKVMTEVGTVTVQVPRDRLGTFSPRLLPKYARRTGALDEMVLSLTAKPQVQRARAEVPHPVRSQPPGPTGEVEADGGLEPRAQGVVTDPSAQAGVRIVSLARQQRRVGVLVVVAELAADIAQPPVQQRRWSRSPRPDAVSARGRGCPCRNGRGSCRSRPGPDASP